jgi:hypothetical protein
VPEVNLDGYISNGIEKTNNSKSRRTLVGMLPSVAILNGTPIIEAVLVGVIHQVLPARFLDAINLLGGPTIVQP